MFEDPRNELGGDFLIKLATNPKEGMFEFLNLIWESLTQDVITKRIPHSNQILGVRIVDKCYQGKVHFRIEVWHKINN